MVEFKRQTIISFPNRDDIEDITTGIYGGSLSIEEILTENGLDFGTFNSSKFECKLYELPDVNNEDIIMYQMDNDVKRTVFTGIVDSCKKDKLSHYREIIAYDKLYTVRNKDIGTWWETFWGVNTQVSIKTLRESLLTHFGIKWVETTLINDGIIVTKMAEFESMPFETLFSAICQVQLCFPKMNRSGVMEFVQLETDTSKAVEVTQNYKPVDSIFESYTIAPITRIAMYNKDNELVGIAGTGDNCYTINDNMILAALDKTTVQAMADTMLEYIQSIQFTPMELVCIQSDLTYYTGELLYVNGVYSYIFSISMSGVQLIDQTLTSQADEYISDSTAYSAEVQYTKDKASQVLDTVEANYVKTDTLDAKYATIDKLNATNATVETLQTGVANINTIMFGSATGTSLTTEFSNSIVSLIGDAQIKSAQIESISASKILAGNIYTNNVHIYGDENENLSIVDNTIQINDGTTVRVQIGKDASGDYNMYVWDSEGKLMFDAAGLTYDGITRQIIRDDVVADNANIAASKLDIESLFTEINNSTQTINSSKIYIDANKQTLDVAFNTMSTSVESAIKTADTASETANSAAETAKEAASKIDGTVKSVEVLYAQGSYDAYATASGNRLKTASGNLLVGTTSSAPTTGWSTTAPEWENNKTVWQKTVTTYNDGTVSESDPVNITGATGSSGVDGNDGISVTNDLEQYYLSSSDEELIDGYWSFESSWETGKYIWTRHYITWSDGTITTTVPVLYGALNTVTETVHTQGTEISTIQGQISSKIWEQDITTAVDNIDIGGSNLLVDSETLANEHEVFIYLITVAGARLYTASGRGLSL